MTRDLNETSRFGEVDGSVADFGEEDGIDDGVVLEVLEDAHALDLRGAAVDVEFAEFLGVGLHEKLQGEGDQREKGRSKGRKERESAPRGRRRYPKRQ